MHVEDNLDSDIFYDFWQLSGCAVVLCRNVGHISKITTEKYDLPFILLSDPELSAIKAYDVWQEKKSHDHHFKWWFEFSPIRA